MGTRRSQVKRCQVSEPAVRPTAAGSLAKPASTGLPSPSSARAGTSRGSPAHHFGSENSLVACVASATRDRITGVLASMRRRWWRCLSRFSLRSRSDSRPRASTISAAGLGSTRWPERETVDNWSQGVHSNSSATCGVLVDHYDFEAAQQRLNAWPHSKRPSTVSTFTSSMPLPRAWRSALVMVARLAGTVVEFLEVLGPLTDPATHGGARPMPSTWSAPRCPGTATATNPRRLDTASVDCRGVGDADG